ncbi:hypothetical protein FH972_024361 [Carpinus fangiana]|uniref:Alpha-methylacyl-CoA racemase n=1 Tax=Carpinus fangiana TaxID=176857 RepID=A0A5N6KYJ8_9ROSI|nr:hypothetical protein FH972_024361 [Carpinus fangiana]
MAGAPPLSGIRVLEFAGLAPGPFAGMMLADFGATVLRVDRAHPAAHSSKPPPATPDQLVRHKSSIAVDMKSPAGIALLKAMLTRIDVVIDPFRPGVLERLGLDPEKVMLQINPRLIVARMTGFRRDGKYKDMAGHDINYIAVSGVLSMLGRAADKPYAPANILGDFAGGGGMCFMGILLALMARNKSGRGQVVEANMVDGAAYLASMPRLATKPPKALWTGPRGTNMLDGGAPWYDTYETADGKYMSVGALEPQFWAELLKGLGLRESELPGRREDPRSWSAIRTLFEERFKSRSRSHWEGVFDGTDACVAPVLEQRELEAAQFDQRPPVTLRETPALAIAQGPENRPAAVGQGQGVDGGGWNSGGLRPGVGGEDVLARWLGWQRGKHYQLADGGLSLLDGKARL